MIIQPITKEIDVIIPGDIDLDKISPIELIDHIELENSLFFFERMKRKRTKSRNSTFFKFTRR